MTHASRSLGTPANEGCRPPGVKSNMKVHVPGASVVEDVLTWQVPLTKQLAVTRVVGGSKTL